MSNGLWGPTWSVLVIPTTNTQHLISAPEDNTILYAQILKTG